MACHDCLILIASKLMVCRVYPYKSDPSTAMVIFLMLGLFYLPTSSSMRQKPLPSLAAFHADRVGAEGVQCGSDIFNSKMKQWLKKRLGTLPRYWQNAARCSCCLPTIDRALKCNINYKEENEDDLELYLEGRNTSYTLEVHVPADVVTNVKHKDFNELLALNR